MYVLLLAAVAVCQYNHSRRSCKCDCFLKKSNRTQVHQPVDAREVQAMLDEQKNVQAKTKLEEKALPAFIFLKFQTAHCTSNNTLA